MHFVRLREKLLSGLDAMIRIQPNFAQQGPDFIAVAQMKRANFNGTHLSTNGGPNPDSLSRLVQPRI